MQQMEANQTSFFWNMSHFLDASQIATVGTLRKHLLEYPARDAGSKNKRRHTAGKTV